MGLDFDRFGMSKGLQPGRKGGKRWWRILRKTVGIMAHYWDGSYTIGMVAILLKMWLTIGMVAILLEWWL